MALRSARNAFGTIWQQHLLSASGGCIPKCDILASRNITSFLPRRVNSPAARLQALGFSKIFGRDQIRTPKSAYKGSRLFSSSLGRYYRRGSSEDQVLYGLIAANVAVFCLWQSNPSVATRHFTISLDGIKNGRIHTLLTSTFSQREMWHLAGNMLGLFFFGRSVAQILGGRGLLTLYLGSGLAGSLVYVLGQARNNPKFGTDPFERWFRGSVDRVPALGASGAVSGIVTCEIVLAPFGIVNLYGVFPIYAWMLGAAYLYTEISGLYGHGRQDVGYSAHLAGAACGGLTALGVRYGRFPFRWRRW